MLQNTHITVQYRLLAEIPLSQLISNICGSIHDTSNTPKCIITITTYVISLSYLLFICKRNAKNRKKCKSNANRLRQMCHQVSFYDF